MNYFSKNNGSISQSKSTSLLDLSPSNVMICDPNTFNVSYVNKTCKDTLNSIQELLPNGVSGDTIIGQCIDVFHKNPSHQRSLLSNPSIFPYKTIIRLGPEILELNADRMDDGDICLYWSVVTEREQLKIMVDEMPLNVLMADLDTFEVTFANKTSKNTLNSISQLLPAGVDGNNITGQCIDIFHKNPQMQRSLMGDPSNLPHKARIHLGEETLDLDVSAVVDDGGHYIGPMVSWSVSTAQYRLANNVRDITGVVASASTQLQSTSENLMATADQTSQQATAVAASSEQAAANVQTVASAAEELASSIEEVGRQVSQSTKITQSAVEDAAATNKKVEGLADAAQKIGEVVSLIKDVADQTNLLALNATIEAARAGDAGKGFAVVASEVKNLANQTGKATEEISNQITAIQNATTEAVSAIRNISNTIDQVSDIAGQISESVEQQALATQEIARNVQEASTGTQEVTTHIVKVTAGASETGQSSGEVKQAADELSLQASKLEEEIEGFLKT
jgi:methyl-accepting chemotaxis protein